MLLKLAALGAAGYAGYRYLEKNGYLSQTSPWDRRTDPSVAALAGQSSTGATQGHFNKVDDTLDQSFPASDPPANY